MPHNRLPPDTSERSPTSIELQFIREVEMETDFVHRTTEPKARNNRGYAQRA